MVQNLQSVETSSIALLTLPCICWHCRVNVTAAADGAFRCYLHAKSYYQLYKSRPHTGYSLIKFTALSVLQFIGLINHLPAMKGLSHNHYGRAGF